MLAKNFSRHKGGRRMVEGCANVRIVGVELVVEVVPVQVPLLAVPVEIANVEVAIGVAEVACMPPRTPPVEVRCGRSPD